MSATDAKPYGKVVENGTHAVEVVNELKSTGYGFDDIFVLAHQKDRTDKIADTAGTQEIGIKEEGLFDSLANVFRSRGDELRSKMTSLGFTKEEADFYEEELDRGKVLVIARRHT